MTDGVGARRGAASQPGWALTPGEGRLALPCPTPACF